MGMESVFNNSESLVCVFRCLCVRERGVSNSVRRWSFVFSMMYGDFQLNDKLQNTSSAVKVQAENKRGNERIHR